MNLIDTHARNLGAILSDYNKLSRSMRRKLHGLCRRVPEAGISSQELSADFVDDYIEAANIAAYLDASRESSAAAVDVLHLQELRDDLEDGIGNGHPFEFSTKDALLVLQLMDYFDSTRRGDDV